VLAVDGLAICGEVGAVGVFDGEVAGGQVETGGTVEVAEDEDEEGRVGEGYYRGEARSG
jgi:hypothetical protein